MPDVKVPDIKGQNDVHRVASGIADAPQKRGKKATIVGAGINGLVAANYLLRDGFDVTVLERSPVVGGACSDTTVINKGSRYTFNKGATVLGYMQDFVWKETGLQDRLRTYLPPPIYVCYFNGDESPYLFSDGIEKMQGWRGNGKDDFKGFAKDLERVKKFLIKGFREARVPTIKDANQELGEEMVQLWITGSGRALLDRYFTSNNAKRYFSYSLIENSVSEIDEPYSAFNIPLRESGSVFNGSWGFVSGGIANVTKELGRINADLGAKIITSARVTGFSQELMEISYEKNGLKEKVFADYVIFATEPLTAARLCNEDGLLKEVYGKKFEGSSGKSVMFFKKISRYWLRPCATTQGTGKTWLWSRGS